MRTKQEDYTFNAFAQAIKATKWANVELFRRAGRNGGTPRVGPMYYLDPPGVPYMLRCLLSRRGMDRYSCDLAIAEYTRHLDTANKLERRYFCNALRLGLEQQLNAIIMPIHFDVVMER